MLPKYVPCSRWAYVTTIVISYLILTATQNSIYCPFTKEMYRFRSIVTKSNAKFDYLKERNPTFHFKLPTTIIQGCATGLQF